MDVTLLGNRVFADDQVKTGSLGWASIEHDRCPYKKSKLGPRDRCVTGKHQVNAGVMLSQSNYQKAERSLEQIHL